MNNIRQLVRLGVASRRAFRRWRQVRRAKKAIKEFSEEHGSVSLQEEKQVFKGNLTYTAVLAGIAPVISNWLGFEIVPEELVPFVQAAAAALALYGRWRATK